VEIPLWVSSGCVASKQHLFDVASTQWLTGVQLLNYDRIFDIVQTYTATYICHSPELEEWKWKNTGAFAS